MVNRIGRLFFVSISVFVTFINGTKGQCYYAQTDKFENVWVVDKSEVICFDKQLKKIGTYSNFLLGQPTYVDALDPFRVIVFFPSSQSIVLLNNEVAEISKQILLREKGIADASAVCRSGKGGFWVFDRTRWEILHFDSGFNLTNEKIMLDMTFSGSKPLFMQENKGVLYIAFKDKAICRYDQFGARMGDIQIKVDNFFTFIDGSILYQTKGITYQYSIDSSIVIPLNSSVKCIPIQVQGQLLYFDGRSLSVYKI